MHSWSWHEGFLTCDLLSPWPHGFFTRNHAPKLPQDLHQYLSVTGKVHRAKQVHGDRLLINPEILPNLPLPEADGVIVTQGSGDSAWVCSADCVPVLIGDRRLGTVAAIHAGWRGTAANILPTAISKFLALGSEVRDLRVALGPAISGEEYQVQTEVAERVVSTISTKEGILPDEKPGHNRLDLRAVQFQQLIEANLSPSQIAIAPYCTLQTPDRFFSYRRYVLSEATTTAPKNVQVQWSGIAIA